MIPLSARRFESGPTPAVPPVALPAASEAAFRNAMALLAGGVAIVSCWDDGAPKGLLVSALTAVSVEPPRLLFCVRKAASAHDALLRSDTCAVAILAEHHQAEAEVFAASARAAERFDPARWRLDPDAPPSHRAPLVGLEGHVSHRIDAGANTIFILDVAQADSRGGQPLVYFDRGFRQLDRPDDLTPDLESLAGVTVWSPASKNRSA